MFHACSMCGFVHTSITYYIWGVHISGVHLSGCTFIMVYTCRGVHLSGVHLSQIWGVHLSGVHLSCHRAGPTDAAYPFQRIDM